MSGAGKQAGGRRLFCELSPFAYALSVKKCIFLRNLADACGRTRFAKTKQEEPLPVCIYKHTSLIRRKLGNVDAQLQENKAVNLALAAPKIDRLLIRPGEVFSFWRTVGSVTAAKGYQTGLTIRGGEPSSDIGGGMCQMTNLIHWMVLHSPLSVVEHHHHDGIDLFPDFGRKVPFGTGTSVFYNYIDYRVLNPTEQPFQLIVYTTDEYLCGELRTTQPLPYAYHISCEGEGFVREDGVVYRVGQVFRAVVDKRTGDTLSKVCIKQNHARVLYDTAALEVR